MVNNIPNIDRHANYPVAIHALLKRNNQYLLIRRYNTGYEDGKYSLVAGHVELGENIIDAVIREAKEEVGIIVKPTDIKICGIMHRKSEDERVDYFAAVDKWENEPRNCEPQKCDNIIWCERDSLPSNTIPYIKRALDKTIENNTGIWFDEYGWNKAYMEELYVTNILNKRGIASSINELESVKKCVLLNIKAIDNIFDNNNENWYKNICECVNNDFVVIGTPILSTISKNKKGLASACAAIKMPINDGVVDYKSLFRTLEDYLLKGVGVGLDVSLSKYPENDVRLIDDFLLDIDNKLMGWRSRPVAVMVTIRGNHPKLKEFINSRMNIKYETTRLTTSVMLKNNEINEDIINLISKSIYKVGNPGVVFLDQLNACNVIPSMKYITTAPCAEVGFSEGEMCHFSYINVSKFVDLCKREFNYIELAKSVKATVRFLDDVVEYSLSSGICDEIVRQKRRIGVGIVGFATTLLQLGIPYESGRACVMAEKIANLISLSSKEASVDLAKERGCFPAFENSRYVDDNWLDSMWIDRNNLDEWNNLRNYIKKFGIRNSTTVAFAPTGTSSKIIGVSSSFEPYLSFCEDYSGDKFIPKSIINYINQNYNEPVRGELVAQLLRNEIDISRFPEFIKATNVTKEFHVKITEIFQRYSDESASKTINMKNATVRDIYDCIIDARNKGLKGISVYNSDSNE